MQQPAPRQLSGAPAPALVADPWLELEEVVRRLVRLVVHADALAERAGRLTTVPERPDPARAERVLRLRAGADLGCRALQAAARLDATGRPGVPVPRLPGEVPTRPTS